MSEEIETTPAQVDNSTGPGEQAVSIEEILAEAQEETKDFLEGLLESMEVEGKVEVRVEDETVWATLTSGDEGGILIGRKGRTLDAIEEITRTAVQNQVRSRVRIKVNADGFRERRLLELQELARTAAEEALSKGHAALEPMTAYERKMVHDTVQTIDGVSSASEGEDPRRRVIVRAD